MSPWAVSNTANICHAIWTSLLSHLMKQCLAIKNVTCLHSAAKSSAVAKSSNAMHENCKHDSEGQHRRSLSCLTKQE